MTGSLGQPGDAPPLSSRRLTIIGVSTADRGPRRVASQVAPSQFLTLHLESILFDVASGQKLTLARARKKPQTQNPGLRYVFQGIQLELPQLKPKSVARWLSLCYDLCLREHYPKG